MKRDMDLMRLILLYLEENYDPNRGLISDVSIEGYEEAVIAEHCKLLHQAGLISDIDITRFMGGGLNLSIRNLTNEGYDYLESIRDEKTWEKVQKTMTDKKIPSTIAFIAKVSGIFSGQVIKQLTD